MKTAIHRPQVHSPVLQGGYPASNWGAHPAYAAPVSPQAQRVTQAARQVYQAPPAYNPEIAHHAPSAPPATLRKPVPQPPQKSQPSQPDPYATNETYDTIRELKYPEELYTQADSKFLQCQWTFISPLKDYRESSVIITNLLVPILEKQVKQPLQVILGQKNIPTLKGELDPSTAQRIQQGIIDPILSKLPKEGEKIDPLWREEARKHVVNIAKASFHEEIPYLAKAFKRVHNVTLQEAAKQILMNPKNSLADALGCEADKVLGTILKREKDELRLLIEQNQENPKLLSEAVKRASVESRFTEIRKPR